MDNTWIDVKYATLISTRLQLFKIKTHNPFLANLRCPLCGDSEKNKLKARGYLFQKSTKLYYKCHNCGASQSFAKFLSKVDLLLHEEYSKEHYLNKEHIAYKPKESIMPTMDPPRFLAAGSPLKKLKKISQLQWDHPAKTYIVNRKIPNEFHARLFYCANFAQWVNTIVPDKLDEKFKSPRLIIPFLDENRNLFGFQGRSFDPKSNLRYITIMLDDRPKIFGLDLINKELPVYVFEGPIDSMFIPNSLAMAGADVKLDSDFKDVVYVFDNEPRNKEIVFRIDKCIDKGYKVVIWDRTFVQKDINDMIMAGNDAEHIKIVLDKRTFRGIEAKAELMHWRKC
jgi:hypothetical protein